MAIVPYNAAGQLASLITHPGIQQKVAKFASQGLPWASKLLSAGWQKLTKGQRKQARNALNLQPKIQANMVPVEVGISKSAIVKGRIPRYKQSAGYVTISHREYLAEAELVNGTDIRGYVLNPSNPRAFTWLCTFARNFEKYRFRNIRLTYVPQAPTTAAGRVILAYDKDSTDILPSGKAELYSYQGTVDTPVWQGTSIAFPCDNTLRFVDSSNTAETRLVDLGQFITCTSAVSAFNGGEFFIDYTVELHTPQQPQPMSERIYTVVGIPAEYHGDLMVVESNNSTTEFGIEWQSVGFYHVSITINGDCSSMATNTHDDAHIVRTTSSQNGTTSMTIAMFVRVVSFDPTAPPGILFTLLSGRGSVHTYVTRVSSSVAFS
ncbi:hypothetical protein 3 [Beihai tombus-like virus 1]|uniref:hypothetical protein 3 n=1 Tax=Beihai tombus-like virus 1 TaxID=1922712 RepID=UPI00090BA4AE|nr:hypothetical protein 3 [Beihai tombus-like virus 1]APG76347.1 hypothetical protein 3 [Beihai tombus-like virus 1]